MFCADADDVSGIHVNALNWTDVSCHDASTASFLHDVDADCVLAADVVYDPSLVPHLVNTLHAILTRAKKSSPPYALVSSTVRNPETYGLFLRTLREKGLEYSIIPPETYTGPHIWGLPLFPSTHDIQMDGRVEILRIQAVPFAL